MDSGKKYVSVDLEASGRTPGKYSMLSLGACIVFKTEKQFYRELKPLNNNYNLEAIKVAITGLRCLDDVRHFPEYNPESAEFKPEFVLRKLRERGEDPVIVMTDFRNWILDSTKGYRPVIAAAPIRWDGMFVAWYFDNFDIEDPFGHSGEDINSIYRGVRRDINVSIKDIKIGTVHSHNALDDAIEQAEKFERILRMMRA